MIHAYFDLLRSILLHLTTGSRPTGARPQDLRMGLGIVEALLEQGALVTALHERDEARPKSRVRRRWSVGSLRLGGGRSTPQSY